MTIVYDPTYFLDERMGLRTAERCRPLVYDLRPGTVLVFAVQTPVVFARCGTGNVIDYERWREHGDAVAGYVTCFLLANTITIVQMHLGPNGPQRRTSFQLLTSDAKVVYVRLSLNDCRIV